MLLECSFKAILFDKKWLHFPLYFTALNKKVFPCAIVLSHEENSEDIQLIFIIAFTIYQILRTKPCSLSLLITLLK